MPKKTRKKKKVKKIKKRKPAKKKKKVLRKSKKRKSLRLKKRKTKSSISKTIGDNEKIYKTKSEWIKKALVTKTLYEKKYNQSLKENDSFWRKEGKRISWIKPYSKIKDVKYSKSDVYIKWFYDGTLNASANCIDRHLKNDKDKTAIIWVGDDPKVQKKISYKQHTLKYLKLQTD